MKARELPTIAVVGHTGMVGSTIYDYFKSRGYTVFGYSRKTPETSLEDISVKADYIFVCVPTPYDWKKDEIDLQPLQDTLNKLIPTHSTVIIKSTVPPLTTERLQEAYDFPILFNPEFLSEKTKDEDFLNPDRQIVGYTKKSFDKATEVLNLLPNSPFDYMMTATEAEIVKYVNNFHGSLMVMFANLINAICERTGGDFEVVKKASQASKWVGSPMGRMYWNVNHGGFKGYGGKCFPKDMHNLMNWLKENNISAEILDATIKANQRILREQNMTEQDAEQRSNR